MGILGLTGFLENPISFYYGREKNEFPSPVKFYEDISQDKLKEYTHIFFDFHALVITVCKFYQESLNYFINIVNSLIIKETNKKQNLNTKLSIDNEITLSKYIIFKFLTTILNDEYILNILLNKNEVTKIVVNESISLEDLKIIFKNFNSINRQKYTLFTDLTIKHVRDIMSKLNKTTKIIIVNDGKPNVAKMTEQLKRRVALKMQDLIVDNLEANLVNLNLISHINTVKFDMGFVSRDKFFLQNICNQLKTEYEGRIEVINNGDENRIEGEGEHIINSKIFEYGKDIIDNNKNREFVPGKNVINTIKFLYYSPDGDTVLLALISKIKLEEDAFVRGKPPVIVKIDQLRTENLNFSYYKIKEKLKTQEIQLSQIFDRDIDINKIKEKYNLIFNKANFKKFDSENNSFEITETPINKINLQVYHTDLNELENILLSDLRRRNITEEDVLQIKNYVLKQYLFLFSVLGNDFIPKLNSLSIGNITNIIIKYNDRLIEEQNFIIAQDMFNPEPGSFKGYNVSTTYNFDNLRTILNDIIPREDRAVSNNFDKETRRKRDYLKEVNEFMDLNKILFLNNNDAVFLLIKYIFDYGYFISPDNLKNSPLFGVLKKKLKDNTDLINNNLLNKDIVIQSENIYFKNLFITMYRYFEYLNNNNEVDNPFNVKNSEIRFRSFEDRNIPVSEIIHFDTTKNNDDASQYINGMCYTYKLYFDSDTSNRCWYYPHEYPPTITTLSEYIDNNDPNNLGKYDFNASKELLDNFHASIDVQKSRQANIYYILANQAIPRYYNIPNLFNCFNVRYANKCPAKANDTFIPIDKENKLVPILFINNEEIKTKIGLIEQYAKDDKKI